jgi:hypothetical protein
VDAFISHSSRNRARAGRLESALEAEGLEIWLDDSEIRLGVLLGEELQRSIADARVFILLWSRPASRSRWVNSEWLMALHQGVFILPCVLDKTPLPQCLQNSVYLNMPRVDARVVERLTRAIREADEGPNPLASVMRAESAELAAAIDRINQRQHEILDRLGEGRQAEAAELQARLDELMEKAERTWPLDPVIVTLGGYHRKNAYMLRHWDAVQAGRAAPDDLLSEAENRFFETLFIDPHDPWPLNGLGSILMFKRDLDAAEFFILAAIREAKARGAGYPDAEQDLETVRRFKRG